MSAVVQITHTHSRLSMYYYRDKAGDRTMIYYRRTGRGTTHESYKTHTLNRAASIAHLLL